MTMFDTRRARGAVLALALPASLGLWWPACAGPAASAPRGPSALAESQPQVTETAGATPESASKAPDAPTDPRPIVRLTVKNASNPEDKIFPQVVEGRLLSDLADMETFRMVEAGEPGGYLLACTIRTLDLATGTNYIVSPDAESDGRPQARDQVTVTMTLDYVLKDAVKEIHHGNLSVQASRDFEISTDHTVSLLTQELVDRAAQRIERMIRKKIPKR